MVKRLVVQGLLSFAFLIVGFNVHASTEGSISGKVVDLQGIAVGSIQVDLQTPQGTTLKTTHTAITGEYEFFPVTLGDYQIVLHPSGFLPSRSWVQVVSGSDSYVEVNLNPLPSSPEMVLQVKAKRRLVQNSLAASITDVSREQIAQLPQGVEISLPKLIATTTPGVVQGSFGQTFIRGNHANIQYQIDGVQLPDSASNTFGQAVSPRNIDHMEVITGGIPAEYGQRLSAVVNIVTKGGAETPEGEIELNYGSYNTFTPHLLYGGSNESGSLHYFFSANYNQTDRGLDTPQPESFENQMQGGTDSVHNFASGNSEFAKIDWLADNQNKLTFIVFNSQSNYEIPNFPASFGPSFRLFQPGIADQFGNSKGPTTPLLNYVPSDTDDRQLEINTYAQVVWKHTFSDRAFLQLAPYYKYSLIKNSNDLLNDLASSPLGATPISGAEPSSFFQNRHVNNLGLKGDYTLRANSDHLIKTGFQLQTSRSDGTISIQTDLAAPPLVDSSPNSGNLESVYVQDDFTLVKSLTFNAGVRFDATQFTLGGLNSSDYLFQPRIGLSYMITDQTQFHIFYGKLFQPAPIENLRYLPDPSNGTFTSLDSYDIKAEKDDFYEAGIAQQLFDKQVAHMNVYYKTGVNILDDFQILNTPIAQPYNFATGYAFGAEFSIKGQISEEWSEYMNYSYGVAKGQGITAGVVGEPANNDYQTLDHVQLHTANAGLTYTKNHFWWTTQGFFGSGLRTGPQNSLNLPSHFTMDTTIGYQFVGKSWLSQFKLSGDILNLFDNRYPITIANGFNGSHYAAGRQFFIRLTKAF